jgi:hypothetical protein
MTSAKLALATILVFAMGANAQDTRPAATPPKEQQAYAFTPDLGDIMSIMQLRHLKLAFAGSLENWGLAAYEATEMRKSFEATAKLFPEFDSVPVAKLIEGVSQPALKEVEEAVRAKNIAAFAVSLKSLTAACNSCHQSSNVGFIEIRVPTSSPFSNQVFAPLQEKH